MEVPMKALVKANNGTTFAFFLSVLRPNIFFAFCVVVSCSILNVWHESTSCANYAYLDRSSVYFVEGVVSNACTPVLFVYYVLSCPSNFDLLDRHAVPSDYSRAGLVEKVRIEHTYASFQIQSFC